MRFYISVLFIVVFSTMTAAQEKVKRNKIFNESIEEGALIYEDFCMNCHMTNGKGVEKIFPPLANSDFLLKQREASIKAVKFGIKGKIVVNGKTYNEIMAPLGLSDQEVADVLNYVSTSWGNSTKKQFSKSEVVKIKK